MDNHENKPGTENTMAKPINRYSWNGNIKRVLFIGEITGKLRSRGGLRKGILVMLGVSFFIGYVVSPCLNGFESDLSPPRHLVVLLECSSRREQNINTV